MTFSATLSATLVTLVTLAILHPGKCASVEVDVAPKEFQYLGSFKDNSRTSSQESHYFASYNAAGWNQAQKDCKNRDATSTLVMIQTADELAAVQEFVQELGNSGTEFWTAGVYDEDLHGFKWGTGPGAMSLQYLPPWAAGHPETLTLGTRIVAAVRSSVKFQSAEMTESYRYICESKNR